MKKTFIALATMGAMAGAAVAADVSIYGLVDYGFNYENLDQGSDQYDSDSFTMKSGMNSGSRVGIKGAEDLGNGLKVGFVLENGFTADDGSIDNGGRLFGREAQLYLQGDFGTLAFGRMGKLISANGSYGLMGKFSVFSGGWGSHTGGKFFHVGDWGRMDNTITYRSPEFAGLQVHAQYSFQPDVDEEHGAGTAQENKGTADRNGQLAVTYNVGNFGLLVAGEWNQWSNLPRGTGTSIDWREKKDGYNFMLGATYDFNVAKIYVTGEYDKHMRIKEADNLTATGMQGAFKDWSMNTGYIDGYAATLGADVPAFGGTFKVDFGYRYGECVVNAANDYEQYGVALGYTYDLSKRTTVYAAGSYTQADLGKIHNTHADDDSLSAYEVLAGMIHRF